jgi:hypothetical protein
LLDRCRRRGTGVGGKPAAHLGDRLGLFAFKPATGLPADQPDPEPPQASVLAYRPLEPVQGFTGRCRLDNLAPSRLVNGFVWIMARVVRV